MKLSIAVSLAALIFATSLFAQSPSSPQDLIKQGRELSSQGKQDEALALYRQAMQADPKLYEAHH